MECAKILVPVSRELKCNTVRCAPVKVHSQIEPSASVPVRVTSRARRMRGVGEKYEGRRFA